VPGICAVPSHRFDTKRPTRARCKRRSLVFPPFPSKDMRTGVRIERDTMTLQRAGKLRGKLATKRNRRRHLSCLQIIGNSRGCSSAMTTQASREGERLRREGSWGKPAGWFLVREYLGRLLYVYFECIVEVASCPTPCLNASSEIVEYIVTSPPWRRLELRSLVLTKTSLMSVKAPRSQSSLLECPEPVDSCRYH
jgi:hypothetical protein